MSRHNQMIAKYQEEIVAKKLQAKKDELAREKKRDIKNSKRTKQAHTDHPGNNLNIHAMKTCRLPIRRNESVSWNGWMIWSAI